MEQFTDDQVRIMLNALNAHWASLSDLHNNDRWAMDAAARNQLGSDMQKTRALAEAFDKEGQRRGLWNK